MRFGAVFTVLIAALCYSAMPGGAQGRQGGGRGGQAVQLPEGPGKELVSTTCSTCHALTMITSSQGYTREYWDALFSSMVTLPNDQKAQISAYLGQHFPPKPDAIRPAVIDGPVNMRVREWNVPTLGSRPHDALAARDGSIWWTGQYTMRLGRLDPATGAMKEFPTGKGTPHGLIEDRDGNIWYTGININVIGKLDPKTGRYTEFPMPDPAARGPHTPIFDQKGILWFTLQSGHVGRLDPATSQVRILKTPTDGTYPYGIQVNSKGVPWYVDFRGNRVGSVDPVTLQITEYPLPHPDARPRRIAITPDDAIWYTDFPRGYVGRFDPVTKQVKEWKSPSGERSQPYGIAAVGNVLYYNESGPRPNTMVRFDTRTEQFQSVIVPSGGIVLRHIMADARGNIALACSGINKVGLLEISSAPRTQ